MISANLAMIIAAELVILLVVICAIMAFKNRSLKRIIAKLQERLGQLVNELKAARASKAVISEAPSKTYNDYLSDMLETTQAHHASLNSSQDIVLDIDPQAPLENRTAALRNAVLLAEIEGSASNANNKTNWQKLNEKYEQIFNFYDDYANASNPELDTPNNNEELDKLTEELSTAKKRINNLERFKQLYFELESKLEDCKQEADKYYNELKALGADGVPDSKAFEQTLDSYHASYDAFTDLLGENLTAQEADTLSEDVGGEIRHLRSVAADQHRIITDLQKKLRNRDTNEDKETVIGEIQNELERQIRFVKESETCIHLMEEELNNANREISQLQAKIKKIPQIKSEYADVRDQNDSLRDQLFSLKTANRRLTQTVEKLSNQSTKPSVTPSQSPSSPSEVDNDENKRLKSELADLQEQYANLEEKFLDLKMQNA